MTLTVRVGIDRILVVEIVILVLIVLRLRWHL